MSSKQTNKKNKVWVGVKGEKYTKGSGVKSEGREEGRERKKIHFGSGLGRGH